MGFLEAFRVVGGEAVELLGDAAEVDAGAAERDRCVVEERPVELLRVPPGAARNREFAPGYKAVGTLVYSWPEAYDKARAADRIVRQRLTRPVREHSTPGT